MMSSRRSRCHRSSTCCCCSCLPVMMTDLVRTSQLRASSGRHAGTHHPLGGTGMHMGGYGSCLGKHLYGQEDRASRERGATRISWSSAAAWAGSGHEGGHQSHPCRTWIPGAGKKTEWKVSRFVWCSCGFDSGGLCNKSELCYFLVRLSASSSGRVADNVVVGGHPPDGIGNVIPRVAAMCSAHV